MTFAIQPTRVSFQGQSWDRLGDVSKNEQTVVGARFTHSFSSPCLNYGRDYDVSFNGLTAVKCS